MHLAEAVTRQSRWATVEFIGLPGVGKSALSHRVAEILQQRGWRVEQPTYATDHEMHTWERLLLKFRLVSVETVFHPVRAVRSVRAILATQQAGVSDLIHVTVNWLFISALFRKAERREGVHIFDEGLLNALWSIGFSAGSWRTVEMLLRLARQRSTPVVAAIMEADMSAIKERLDLRENGHSRLEETRFVEDGWKRALRALEQVKATVRQLTEGGADVRVVIVHNQEHDHLDALANKLAAAFEEILTSRVSGPEVPAAGYLRY